MFKTLVFEDFEHRVGGVFTLCDESGAPIVSLALAEATRLRSKAPIEGMRPPFSLIFTGPADRPLPQSLYPLRHEELGEITILLVPVGRDAHGCLYQSLFN